MSLKKAFFNGFIFFFFKLITENFLVGDKKTYKGCHFGRPQKYDKQCYISPCAKYLHNVSLVSHLEQSDVLNDINLLYLVRCRI